VNVVFSGHDHVYERIKPQKGITDFVEGASGQLRRGDIVESPLTAAYYDRDQTFMLVEVAAEQLTFQTISRTGEIVDSGVIRRRTTSCCSIRTRLKGAAGRPLRAHARSHRTHRTDRSH
jgi:hypothetical protein